MLVLQLLGMLISLYVIIESFQFIIVLLKWLVLAVSEKHSVAITKAVILHGIVVNLCATNYC